MRYTIFIAFCLVFYNGMAFADNGVLKEIITCPSPQAAAFTHYSEYPISPATGIPEINIPLYTIDYDGVQVPISISYHASGIRVNDVASPVGLGWMLNAGGVINRAINCVPDMADGSRVFFRNEKEVMNAIYNKSLNVNIAKNIIQGKGAEDTESDKYMYCFCGRNGSFRYDFSDFTIKSIPYSPVVIKPMAGKRGYVITDTDGAIYYFTERGTSGSVGAEQVTSWFLTRIITPTKRDSILFEYASGSPYVQTLASEYAHYGTAYSYDDDIVVYERTSAVNDYTINKDNYCYSSDLLSSITWNGHTVRFSYSSDRQELDLQKERLRKMVVSNNRGDIIKVVDFSNATYLGRGERDKRMLLSDLTMSGSDVSNGWTYSFTYDMTPLPAYNYSQYITDIQCHEDYWGFYNGGASRYFNPIEFADEKFKMSATDRGAKAAYTQNGILKSITYPTGGTTEFEYENNKVNSKVWGGLRVKSMTHRDERGVVDKEVFTYDSGQSTMNLREDMFRYEANYYYYKYFPKGIKWGTDWHNVMVSTPALPMTGWYGFPVFYQNVTKTRYGREGNIIGKTEYRYMEDRDDIGSCGADGYDYPRFYSDLYNCDQGVVTPLLSHQKEYAYRNNTFVLERETDYAYEEREIDPFCIGVRLSMPDVHVVYNPEQCIDYAPYLSLSEFYNAIKYHDVMAFPSLRLLSKKIEEDHLAGTTVNTIYEYDSSLKTLQPTKITTTGNGGQNLVETREYTFDDMSTTPFGEMANDNFVDVVVQKQCLTNGQSASTMSIDYKRQNDRYLVSRKRTAIGDGQLETDYEITDYDVFGNPCGLTFSGIRHYSVVWGYFHQYPVMLIDGCSYSSLKASVGEALLRRVARNRSPVASDMAAIRRAAESLLGHVTEYRYRPLVGITSVAGSDGSTVAYGYDTNNRLKEVFDHNGNTMEKYLYHYMNK